MRKLTWLCVRGVFFKGDSVGWPAKRLLLSSILTSRDELGAEGKLTTYRDWSRLGELCWAAKPIPIVCFTWRADTDWASCLVGEIVLEDDATVKFKKRFCEEEVMSVCVIWSTYKQLHAHSIVNLPQRFNRQINVGAHGISTEH